MNEIISQLRIGTREWHKRDGMDAAELSTLREATQELLPDGLVELLMYSNGGEGRLALPPRHFVLDPVEEVIRSKSGEFETNEFPGLIFFGGNGGIERIALDTRGEVMPWPVVMIDPVVGMSSLEQIAEDFDAFAQAIGVDDRGDQTPEG